MPIEVPLVLSPTAELPAPLLVRPGHRIEGVARKVAEAGVLGRICSGQGSFRGCGQVFFDENDETAKTNDTGGPNKMYIGLS